MYIPLNYNQINAYENRFIPSMVKSTNNKVFSFWERALFQRACSVIEIKVPEMWKGAIKDFLYWCLFRFGYVAVFETDELGTVFNPCNLYGFNFYYQPTNCVIANPTLDESLDLEIGKDASLIRMTPDYLGVWDIIGYHAEKLAGLDASINTSIINSKIAYILAGKNKATVQALKKMMDKINRGEPAVFLDKALTDDAKSKDSPFQLIERSSLKEQYLTTDLLMDFQTILNSFDKEIGISTVPYFKKERMNADETNSNNEDAKSRCMVWLDTLNDSFIEVNKMFPALNLSASLRNDGMMKEGVENE